MVRIGALDMLDGVPPGQLWPLVSPLLSDPIRGVRLRAVSLLAGVPSERLSDSDRERLDSATREFIAAQRLNADRPEARATLGNFYARRGETAEAETEYKAALQLSPLMGLPRQISPISIGSLGAMPTRKAYCARQSKHRRRMPACITRSG